MKINKCKNNHYTLENICKNCKEETKSAHYKFIKIKDAKDTNEKSKEN